VFYFYYHSLCKIGVGFVLAREQLIRRWVVFVSGILCLYDFCCHAQTKLYLSSGIIL